MFEDRTYENLMAEVIANAPRGIDTRQGSIFFDAVSGPVMQIAKLWTDLDLIFTMTTVATAAGDALDARASEYGLYRLKATPAMYKAIFTGITPQTGERFYYDGLYFVLRSVTDAQGDHLVFEAEIPGESGNRIYEGTPAVPVNTIVGLISATFGEIYANGTDVEDDESLRRRVQEKLTGPAENGNKQHYKTWCESFDGVGQARIFPLWNGPNTVKAVLIDGEGKACSEELVRRVQEYVDPATKGYTAQIEEKTYVVGDGLGEGVANLGAHFTAVAAEELVINIEFKADLAHGALESAAQEEAEQALTEYLKELVLDARDAADVVVRASTVGATIIGLQSVLDYAELTINGGTENIYPGEDGVPVLGEVKLHAIL